MDSFEDLDLKPELVEALLAEGVEVPTDLQTHAIPVLRRGNSAVIRGGPGAGSLVAWGAPLLDRLEAGAGQPVALVLVPTREAAGEVARSLGRLGLASGHRCAALDGGWALPGHADVIVTTPEDLERAVATSDVKADRLQALVMYGAGALLEGTSAGAVEAAVELLPSSDVQLVLVADPVTPRIRSFVDRHLRRAVFIPSEAGGQDAAEAPVQRGRLNLQVTDAPPTGPDVAVALGPLLDDPVHHALLYFRSEDRAADVGDVLSLQGFRAGSPGDAECPVWLGLDALEARSALEASGIPPGRVVVVSVDMPADADTLDRRHGGKTAEGLVLAQAREVPHLRRIARTAGYELREARPEELTPDAPIAAFRAQVAEALETEDLAAYMTLLEPLLDRWSGVEVAAALAAILRRSPTEVAPGEPRSTSRTPAATPGPRPPAWTRVFLTIGSRDGAGPGDILGAITGEAKVEGEHVGRIDIRDTFTRVDVEASRAEQVIQALNGITIRGRSVRADFDRGSASGGGKSRSRGPRG